MDCIKMIKKMQEKEKQYYKLRSQNEEWRMKKEVTH